jgi:hypothetical protein
MKVLYRAITDADDYADTVVSLLCIEHKSHYDIHYNTEQNT